MRVDLSTVESRAFRERKKLPGENYNGNRWTQSVSRSSDRSFVPTFNLSPQRKRVNLGAVNFSGRLRSLISNHGVIVQNRRCVLADSAIVNPSQPLELRSTNFDKRGPEFCQDSQPFEQYRPYFFRQLVKRSKRRSIERLPQLLDYLRHLYTLREPPPPMAALEQPPAHPQPTPQSRGGCLEF